MRDSNTAIGRSHRNRDREVVPQTPDNDEPDNDEPDENQNAGSEQDAGGDEDLEPAIVPIEDE